MWFKDARIYQIGFLASFLVLGIATRDWTLQPTTILLILATCGLTQALLVGLLVLRQYFPTQITRSGLLQHWLATLRFQLPSVLITGLSLSLLLRSDHYIPLMLAAVLAILSKFILRYNDRHIFNPANFGIVAALVLTPNAWVSPGQWGSEAWMLVVFLATGGLVLQKVGRWDTSGAFLLSYAGLEALRNAWLGWTWDVWAHRLMNGSLLLFALFMITDPRTIPNTRLGRLLWAVAIAGVTFMLRNVYFNASAPFWALFALAPLRMLLDWWQPAPNFTWFVNPPFPFPGNTNETLTKTTQVSA